MSVDTRTRLGDPSNAAAQWAANLLGPVAVLLGLEIGYALVYPACRSGDLLPVHLTFGAALALALLGAAIGWREWRRWGTALPGPEESMESRSRFMAVLGLALSLFSALVLGAQWLASLFLHPCQ